MYLLLIRVITRNISLICSKIEIHSLLTNRNSCFFLLFFFHYIWFIDSENSYLKLICVRYFLPNVCFQTNDRSLKTMKNVFYFILSNKNLTHFVWYLGKEKKYDIETLSIDRVLNKEDFYGKFMHKMCTKSKSQTPF